MRLDEFDYDLDKELNTSTLDINNSFNLDFYSSKSFLNFIQYKLSHSISCLTG